MQKLEKRFYFDRYTRLALSIVVEFSWYFLINFLFYGQVSNESAGFIKQAGWIFFRFLLLPNREEFFISYMKIW